MDANQVYINYTGDKEYLAPYGFEVLLGISRFWSQRVNWSEEKQQFVLLGVTGPNEYENNVNNNFHTNYMAVWTLKYTLEVITGHPQAIASNRVSPKPSYKEGCK